MENDRRDFSSSHFDYGTYIIAGVEVREGMDF